MTDDLLNPDDLAFMRETQAEARPTAADLRAATPGGSDAMGGRTDATLGDPQPVQVRIYRNLNLQGSVTPAELGDRYGSSLVKVTADLVAIPEGSTITTAGHRYQVVSGNTVQAWSTATVVWAVEI